MKMGEIEGVRRKVRKHESQSKGTKAPNVMKVPVGEIYTRQSEGEMEC